VAAVPGFVRDQAPPIIGVRVGALPPPNTNGEYAKTVRIPRVKPSRLYEINPEKLENARS
jgi:hypothetical protein